MPDFVHWRQQNGERTRKRRKKSEMVEKPYDPSLPNYCAPCNTRVGDLETHWREECKGTFKALCPRCPQWKPWSYSRGEIYRLRDMHVRACPGAQPVLIPWENDDESAPLDRG